jgi:predicted transposase/invertase (TIGR01784 family)
MIAEVAKMDNAIMTAEERMIYVTGDAEAIRAYWRRQMAIADRIGELGYARDKGFDEGFDEGLNKGKVAIARNLLAKGSTVEFVHEVTGLDTGTIESLGK